jgi:hypothetical protein
VKGQMNFCKPITATMTTIPIKKNFIIAFTFYTIILHILTLIPSR